MTVWMGWLERLVGLSFVASGIAKFFNLGEDVAQTFQAMADANAGTELASLSQWIVQFSTPVSYLVGLLMVVTGLAQLLRRPEAKWAAIVQLAMIVVFVSLLHRAFPAVFLDGFYVMALVPLAMASRHLTAQAS